jgi:hypothetical protein
MSTNATNTNTTAAAAFAAFLGAEAQGFLTFVDKNGIFFEKDAIVVECIEHLGAKFEVWAGWEEEGQETFAVVICHTFEGWDIEEETVWWEEETTNLATEADFKMFFRQV